MMEWESIETSAAKEKGRLMGLLGWFNKKADSASLKTSWASLERVLHRCEADDSYTARCSHALADAMEDMWPRRGLDALEYVVALGNSLRRENPQQLFDAAHKLLVAGDRSKKELPEFSAAMTILGGWLNAISIAMQRAELSSDAAEKAMMYQGIVADFLGMLSTEAKRQDA